MSDEDLKEELRSVIEGFSTSTAVEIILEMIKEIQEQSK